MAKQLPQGEVKRLFVEAHEAVGRLDILVSNAGVYQFGALEDVTEAEFHRQFDTNVLGPSSPRGRRQSGSRRKGAARST